MMMVKQTRIVFEASDLVAVKVQCCDCHGEVHAPLTKLASLIDCPLCGHGWEKSGGMSATRQLLRALRDLPDDGDGLTRTVTFEIDAEPTGR